MNNTPENANAPEGFLIDAEKCTACMLCVMACAIHHSRKFDKKNSSIEITVFNKERKISIVVQTSPKGHRPVCDYCGTEKEPLCVKYCIPKAIICQEIKE